MKSHKNILIYYVGYVTIKGSKYVKIYSVNPLCLIVDKVNGYFEDINRIKDLKLGPTNEGKEKVKRYEELWSKIKVLIRLITRKLDDYDEKYLKIKFNSNVELFLNKIIENPSMIIVVRAVFHENNKHYPQVFLNECLYKL